MPRWLALALLLLAAANLTRALAVPLTPDRPVDVRPLYLGARLLLRGSDPYDDLALKAEWSAVTAREGLASQHPPGLPRTPLVYPPWALPVFIPLALLPYAAAIRVWSLLLPVLLAAAAVLVAHLAPVASRWVAAADLVLLAFAAKVTEWILWVGQPVPLCLAIGFAGWALARRGRPLAAGLCLGLAAFKVTVVVPFVAVALLRGDRRQLAVSALVVLALLATFGALVPDPADSVSNLRATVAELRRLTFDHPDEEISHKLVTKTELAALAEAVWSGAHRRAEAINALPIVALLLLWARPLLRGRVDSLAAFSITSLATLIATHHLHYDVLLLLPIYLVAARAGPGVRRAALVAAAPLLVPVNGLVEAFHLPVPVFVLFNVQLSLLALAAVVSTSELGEPRPRLPGRAA